MHQESPSFFVGRSQRASDNKLRPSAVRLCQNIRRLRGQGSPLGPKIHAVGSPSAGKGGKRPGTILRAQEDQGQVKVQEVCVDVCRGAVVGLPEEEIAEIESCRVNEGLMIDRFIILITIALWRTQE